MAATKAAAAAKKAAPKKAPVPESANAPRHQVVDDWFVWIGDGEAEPIRIPLRVKTKLIRAINRLSKDEDADELDQLIAMLDGLGDQATVDAIDELFFDDTAALVEAYFTEFAKKNEASPGESQGS